MYSGVSFREHQEFCKFARDLVRLPGPGDGALDYLLPEARWRELVAQIPDEEAWLMALSQATGVYFFPSREWVETFMRYLKFLGVTRLLEAGAGRGYLTAALAPLCAAAGISFRAVDKGEGEFVSDLPVYPGVERGDALSSVQEFKPEIVVYAWPPPGQSVAEICHLPFLHYLILVAEAEGGTSGAREDWLTLPQRWTKVLSRYGRGRTGQRHHRVTVFYGGCRKGSGRPGAQLASSDGRG